MSTTKKFQAEALKLFENNQKIDNVFLWKNMQVNTYSDNIYYYSIQLYKALVMSQKKHASLAQHQQAMLATLMFLQFYNKTGKNYKKKSQALLQENRKLLTMRKSKIDGHSLWVLNLYLDQMTQSQFAENFISRLCFAPNNLTSIQNQIPSKFESILFQQTSYHQKMKIFNNEKMYKVLKNISSPQKISQTKVLTFSYICFLDFMRGTRRKVSKQQKDKIDNNDKNQKQDQKKQDEKKQKFQKDQKIINHILQVLKGLVHTFRSSRKFEQFLILMINLIKNLIIMTGFFSSSVHLQITSWMNQLRNQPGKLGHLAYQTFQLLHLQLKSPGTVFRKKLRRDFPALDIKEATSLNKPFYLITTSPSFLQSKQYCSLMTLRKLIIYNGIGASGYEKMDDVYKDIQGLNKQSTFKTYYKVLRIIAESSDLQTYEKISNIQKIFLKDVPKYCLSNQRGKNKKQQLQQVDGYVQHDTPMNFFDYPPYQIKDVMLKNFIDKNSQFYHARLIENYDPQVGQKDFYKNKIPFIFYGDQTQFSIFIRGLSIYLQKIKQNQIHRISVYLIPKYQCDFDLASYLAARDLWYDRYVYNAFHQQVIYPRLTLSQETRGTFPHDLLSKTLQMYLRQAQKVFPINIWKCILCTKGSSQKKEIFFYSHVLIGNSAECQALKQEPQKEHKYSKHDYVDLLTQKIKKFYPVIIKLQMNYVQNGLNAGNLKTLKQELIDVEDFMICNLPYQYFMGKKPHPGDGNLQISLLHEGNAKIFRRQLTNNDNFKRNLANDISKSQFIFHDAQEAFKDLWINYSVRYLNIQVMNKQPVKVVIDNVVHHKIQKIIIAPAYNEHKQLITLPIKCFLPFQ